MKQKIIMLLFFAFTSLSVFGQPYIFYLHGKIVEDQGLKAVDKVNGFGTYRYQDIIDTFREEQFTVISEVRIKNTDVKEYARKVQHEIEILLKHGVRANDITVVGASKGAIIAMLVSSYLKNPDVNFVFMAACYSDIPETFPEIKFCGNILSIYEKSDDIGRSCADLKKASPLVIPHYKEIEINTDLKHGFLYKPLNEWMVPCINWARKKYQ